MSCPDPDVLEARLRENVGALQEALLRWAQSGQASGLQALPMVWNYPPARDTFGELRPLPYSTRYSTRDKRNWGLDLPVSSRRGGGGPCHIYRISLMIHTAGAPNADLNYRAGITCVIFCRP